MDIHRETFKEEACELLAELEASLLDLEDTPDDADLIGRIFRALHTIKGSGAMFGFNDIAQFTHEVETAFDLVRNAKMSASKDLIDLTLSAGDIIRTMIDAVSPEEVDRPRVHQITMAIREMLSRAGHAVYGKIPDPPS